VAVQVDLVRGARRDEGVDEVAPEGVRGLLGRRREEVGGGEGGGEGGGGWEGGGGGEVGVVGGAVVGDGLREGQDLDAVLVVQEVREAREGEGGGRGVAQDGGEGWAVRW